MVSFCWRTKNPSVAGESPAILSRPAPGSFDSRWGSSPAKAEPGHGAMDGHGFSMLISCICSYHNHIYIFRCVSILCMYNKYIYTDIYIYILYIYILYIYIYCIYIYTVYIYILYIYILYIYIYCIYIYIHIIVCVFLGRSGLKKTTCSVRYVLQYQDLSSSAVRLEDRKRIPDSTNNIQCGDLHSLLRHDMLPY